MDVVVFVNDIIGIMMLCVFFNFNVSVGLILGIGINVCYMESFDNVFKWDGD